MVVLTDKELVPPPPPYLAVEHARSQSSLSLSRAASASASVLPGAAHARPAAPTLPAHLVLQIVYKTLERTRTREPESAEERIRRTTRTLYWIGSNLRLVDRGFYLASMHLLRSTYLPHYASQIRAPYSSDPFPHTSSASASSSSSSAVSIVTSLQRESRILDLFLLFKAHEDVFTADSALHLARPDSLRDLFDFMQPRARLEDLVREFGVAAGLVYVHPPPPPPRDGNAEYPSPPSASHAPYASPSRFSSTSSLPPPFASTASLAIPPSKPSPSSSSPSSSLSPSSSKTNPTSTSFHPHPHPHPHALPSAALSASFSSRRAGLVLLTRAGRRTIVETPRARAEPLERCASRLVAALKAWLDRGAS